MRKRASSSITLVLIGAAGMAGCGPEPNYVRDSYANLSDCEADWGRPESCEPSRSSASGAGSSGYVYRGPPYGIGGRDDAIFESRQRAGLAPSAPTNRSMASTTTTRGGFGWSAHRFSSGG